MPASHDTGGLSGPVLPYAQQVAHQLPLFVRRILLCGAGHGALPGLLTARPGTRVYEAEAHAAEGFGTFDCVVVCNSPVSLADCAIALARHGWLLARVRALAGEIDALVTALGAAALRVHDAWPCVDEDGMDALICVAVREKYDSLEHVAACRESGHADWGYQLASSCGEARMGTVPRRVALTAEKHACLLDMDIADDPMRRLLLFNAALMAFYQVTEFEPEWTDVYLRQAEFWQRIGDPGMARRTLANVQHIAPGAEVARAIDTYPASPDFGEMTPPEWTPGERFPRVLFVTQPDSHFGLDVLYDGLCEVLGDECVVDFPWKPMLHGAPLPNEDRYPCALTRQGEPLPLDRVLALLGEGCFDLVLWGDVDRRLPQDTARRLAMAAGGTPLFLLDAQDECSSGFQATRHYLGLREAAGYFKREMLASVDYGPRVIPFPFAYPDRLVLDAPPELRPDFLFWAGQRWCGQRELYLSRIEAQLGCRFDRSYEQDEYVRVMRRYRAGLSAFGAGFDTVRYWELPANGCMLISERVPIRLPYDFKDGESAVFFDDVADLEAKAAYYCEHADETLAIARAGHAHLRRYHTGSARAHQVLGWVDELTRETRAGGAS
ncbi:MAG: glycosyltransferase [Nitrospiraceae bacterium]|nr:glycosyltransferase [Nitrospiraceae bacterium]